MLELKLNHVIKGATGVREVIIEIMGRIKGYVLNFSEEKWTYIYILCHFSTLVRRR